MCFIWSIIHFFNGLADGTIVIVSSSGKVKQPIQLNRASVKFSAGRDKAEIVVTAAQSLFLPNVAGMHRWYLPHSSDVLQ